jgi:hypothetical protein
MGGPSRHVGMHAVAVHGMSAMKLSGVQCFVCTGELAARRIGK